MRMAGSGASTGAGPEEAEVDAGFEFAFDNEAFSDKLLRLEVFGSRSEDAPGSGADGASRKRRREEAQGDNGEGINSSGTMMGTPILRVKTIKVNSAIVAAKSPFFLKLFSNGMKESDQRQVTLGIDDSEENAFMELLRFMYSGKLTPTTESTLLVDILMAADKFEVISCIKLCVQQLIGLTMTPQSAVLFLDLASSIPVPAGTALTEAAKKFFVERYKKFLSTEFQDELMTVPLPGIVAILSSNHPGVASQEAVYDFVLRWADSWYPDSEERRRILSSHLLPLVPLLHSRTRDVLIDQPSCILDFTLKLDQCFGLFPSGSICSTPFYCGGHGFFLLATCLKDVPNFVCLLIQKLEDKRTMMGTIDYKIEIKTRPSLRFLSKGGGTSTADSGRLYGFKIPISELIAGKSSCIIDDKLHMRVHLKMKPQL